VKWWNWQVPYIHNYVHHMQGSKFTTLHNGSTSNWRGNPIILSSLSFQDNHMYHWFYLKKLHGNHITVPNFNQSYHSLPTNTLRHITRINPLVWESPHKISKGSWFT
jgi:hypothetical protein